MDSPAIVVLGQPEHEGVLVGRAFDLIGASPAYVNPWDDDGPESVLDLRPQLIVLGLEWMPKHRLVSAAAARARVPVVCVHDGVIEWSYVWNNQGFIRPHGTFLQPLLASHLCAAGRHQARIFASWGLGERVHVVGLPRLDGLAGGRRPETGGRPRILVATANTYGHDVEHKVMVRRAIRDLKQWFEANPSVEAEWRIHRDLAEDLGLPSDRSRPIPDVIRESAAIISSPSTVVLEGMRVGVPVAQMEYRPVPMYLQSAWEIRCADQIGSVIQDMLHPAPQRLAHQDYCLQDELEPGDASPRLAEVLRAALGGTAPQRPAGNGGADPCGRLDYRQVHSQLSVFSASPAALVQYELDAAWQSLERQRAKCRELAADRDRQVEALRERTAVAEFHARRAEEASREANRWRQPYMQEGERKLKALGDRLARRGLRRIVVYGAGEVGLLAANACHSAGLDVVGVTDGSRERWGAEFLNLHIEEPDIALARRLDAVIAGTFSSLPGVRRAARKLLRKRNVSVPVVGVMHPR